MHLKSLINIELLINESPLDILEDPRDFMEEILPTLFIPLQLPEVMASYFLKIKDLGVFQGFKS